MTVAVVSRSDAVKEEVLQAIRENGSWIEAVDYRDLRSELGCTHISMGVFKSALWKLVCRDHKLYFYTVRDGHGRTAVEAYGYKLV